MTSKVPDRAAKPWSPDDPLSLDKAFQKNPSNQAIADRLRKAEDTHLGHPSRGQRPIQPTNHKPFNRQKKG
jgi:hypothetical protein